MDTSPDGLLPIGRFAERSRLSLKALRLYDRLGLLTPARTDPDSGYRCYHPDQLRTAHLVLLMRRIGMPLEQIQRILGADPALAAELVLDYWRSVEARMSMGRQSVEDLGRLLSQEEVPMEFVIETREIPPLTVLSVNQRVPIEQLPDYLRKTFDKLRQIAADAGVREAAPARAIFHGPVNPEADGPVEVCLPVEAHPRLTKGLVLRQLEGGTAAVTQISGDQCDFPAILDAYKAVAHWIHQQGHRASGPPREVYLQSPQPETGPEELIEIHWPYA